MKYLKTAKSISSLAMMLLANFVASAQSASGEPEMADLMRSNGKIYVVVTVLTVIFLGIVVYLISLDRKLSKLEKMIKNK